MGFLTDAGYPCRDNPDGIPEVSLVYHDGEDVVRLQNIMLPDVDQEIRERGLAQKDTLYRVDYLGGGKPRMAMGKLEAGSGNPAFLEWLSGKAAGSGDVGTQILCVLLKNHLALCALEGLARREISPQGEETGEDSAGEGGQYRQADAAYYGEVLAYAENARRILNMQPCPVLPPFPERGPFLAGWYRNNKDSKGGRQNED